MKMVINVKKQAGFNLIEVLLAFLILSIGLLGVAGMQTTAMKASHTAMLKTVAISKVQDIAERIRANTEADLKDYELGSGGAGTDRNCDDRGSPAAVECTPKELADNDLFVWKNSLTNGALPAIDTDASIVVDENINPPVARITVTWLERGETMEYATLIQQLPPRGQ